MNNRILRCHDTYNFAISRYINSHRLIFFIYVAYAIVSAFIYLNYNVMVYDEVWFYSIAQAHVQAFENSLGYGDLYWLFLQYVHSKLALRAIALVCMFSVPLILYMFGEKLKIEPNRRHLVILIWLTFPASWWTGKLIGPELYCTSIGFLGLYLAYPPVSSPLSQRIGAFLLGCAAGIKLSFIIFPVFYFIILLINIDFNKEETSYYKRLSKHLFTEKLRHFYLWCLLGFLVGSPSLIFYPSIYMKNLLNFSSNHWHILETLIDIISMNIGHGWDTLNPSLASLSISVIIIFLLAMLIWDKKVVIKKKDLFIAYLVALFASILLISHAYTYVSWFWFPLIVLSALLFYAFEMPKKTLILIIILNGITSIPLITAQLYNKLVLMNIQYNQPGILSFVADKEKLINEQGYKISTIIAIRPETGSEILPLNENIRNAHFKKPTLIAVHKIMMVAYSDRSNVVSYLWKQWLTNDTIANFRNALSRLTIYGYDVNYLGAYKDVFVFFIHKNK